MAGLGGLLRLPDLHATSCMVCLSLWRKLPLLFLWLSTSVFMFGMFWPGLRWHLFLTMLCPVGHISYDNTLPSPQCFFKFFQQVRHVFCIFLVQPLMQIRPHFPILSRSPVWCSMGVADDSNFDFSSPSRCLMSPLWPHHRFLGLYPGYTPLALFLFSPDLTKLRNALKRSCWVCVFEFGLNLCKFLWGIFSQKRSKSFKTKCRIAGNQTWQMTANSCPPTLAPETWCGNGGWGWVLGWRGRLLKEAA